MRLKITFCILWLFLFASALCFAQMGSLTDDQERVSGFAGTSLYSRTLDGEEKEEKIQQLVFPILLAANATDNLSIRVYQTLSYAKLEDPELEKNSELNGLENTKLRAFLSLFEDAIRINVGFSFPISETEPEMETARLDSLLYSDLLQFGVIRISEGFDFDAGFGFVQPIGDLSLGFGAGYILRGGYDRLSLEGKPVEYNPGDTISATAGFQIHAGLTKLLGKMFYLHFGTDTLDEEDAFKSGQEFSFIASLESELKPLVFSAYFADTLKSESDEIQEGIILNNLFKNRINGGISIAYPLFNRMLIPRIYGNLRNFSGDASSKAISSGGGLELVFSNNLVADVFGSFLTGDMDDGEISISGFSLGLVMNYVF